jgi:hypothetical protein
MEFRGQRHGLSFGLLWSPWHAEGFIDQSEGSPDKSEQIDNEHPVNPLEVTGA